jgi:hypothetical protein
MIATILLVLCAWVFIDCVLLSLFDLYFLTNELSKFQYRVWVVVMLPALIVFKVYDAVSISSRYIKSRVKMLRKYFN